MAVCPACDVSEGKYHLEWCPHVSPANPTRYEPNLTSTELRVRKHEAQRRIKTGVGVSPEPTSKVKSDGSSSSYYFLPKGATELNDLIEHKEMSFARGNLFKALYRLGEKEGVDHTYDLNKCQLFLDRLKDMQANGRRL